MTATCTPNANGRTERRTLAAQIDRFDSMLDGLDAALLGAVKEAIQQSTGIAVAEAVRATLLEIAANPDLLTLLRPAAVPTPAPVAAKPNVEGKISPAQRIGKTIASGWKFTIGKLKSLGNIVAAPVRGTTKAVREINHLWSLRRPVLIALSVGIVIGTAGALSSPLIGGLLSGVGAAGTTLGGQFVAWTRRLYSSLGIV